MHDPIFNLTKQLARRKIRFFDKNYTKNSCVLIFITCNFSRLFSYLFGILIDRDGQSFKALGIVTQSRPQLCIFMGFGVHHGFQACQFRQFGRTDFDQIRLLISIGTRIGPQILFFGSSRRRICNYIENNFLVWLLVIKRIHTHAKFCTQNLQWEGRILLHLFPLIADSSPERKKNPIILGSRHYTISPKISHSRRASPERFKLQGLENR